MSVCGVKEQPQELRGLHYRDIPLADFVWFKLYTASGELYAVIGAAKKHGDMWLYWRILKPSVAAWREFVRHDVPWLKGWCWIVGARAAFVATNDPADVNFDKMVGLMGFSVLAYSGIKMGWQHLEASDVR